MLHGQNGIRMELCTFFSRTLSQLKYFEAELVIILSPVLTYTMKHAKKRGGGKEVKMKKNTLKYMLLIK